VIERIEVDAAQLTPGGVDGEKLAPDFFLWAVQTDYDDGVRIHGLSWCLFPAYKKLSSVLELRSWRQLIRRSTAGRPWPL